MAKKTKGAQAKKIIKKAEKAVEKVAKKAEEVVEEVVEEVESTFVETGKPTKAEKAIGKVERAVEKAAKGVVKEAEKLIGMKGHKEKHKAHHAEAPKHLPVVQAPPQLQAKPQSQAQPQGNKIPFSEFSKIEFKVGKIIEANDHPNADKLLVLKVDLGNETRTVVAGLKLHYTKEQLKGRKAIFVTNLASANLRGIQSDAMLLAAVSTDESQVIFIAPEKDIAQGTKIR